MSLTPTLSPPLHTAGSRPMRVAADAGRLRRTGLGVLGVALFLSAWEVSSRAGLVDPVLLPRLSRVLEAFVGNWLKPTLASSVYSTEVLHTLLRVGEGFALSALVGVGLGLLIGESEWLSDAVNPVLVLTRYLPPAMLVPILLLFSGKSDATVLMVIIFGAVWPVLLNTVAGVQGVDPKLLDTARLYGLRPLDVVARIVLPMALPQIVAGLRLAVSVCLLAAIVGEMLGGANGLGYAILIAQRTFDYPDMYAGIVLLGIMGLLMNWLFRFVEKKILHWHPIGRTGGAA